MYYYASVIHRNRDLCLLEVYVHQSMTGSDGHMTAAYETLPEEISKKIDQVSVYSNRKTPGNTETQEPSNIHVVSKLRFWQRQRGRYSPNTHHL